MRPFLRNACQLAGLAAFLPAVQAQVPVNPHPICVPAILDDATSNCLHASSVPELGKLYPLSSDLFVDPSSGYVGIGTQSPSARLSVIGEARLGSLAFGTLSGGITFGNSGFLVLPMMTMFPSGTSNPTRMVLAHSPSFPTWGLEYRDQGDEFAFRSSTGDVLTIDLASRRIGIGIPQPTTDLHMASLSDCEILLEADTDGSGSAGRPAITFRQDGGLDESSVGYQAATDSFTIHSNAFSGDQVASIDQGFASIFCPSCSDWRWEDITDTVSGTVLDVEMRLTSVGNLQIDGALSTPASDLAEVYPALGPIEPGDVVAFAQQGLALERARAGLDSPPAGIVSSRPGVLLGLSYTSENETGAPPPAWSEHAFSEPPEVDPAVVHEIEVNRRVPLALAGRVPCKVSAENGPIRPGDLLAVASVDGHAARALAPGPVVGTALEPWDRGEGRIQVFVRPGWFIPPGERQPGMAQSELDLLRMRLDELESRLAALSGEHFPSQDR